MGFMDKVMAISDRVDAKVLPALEGAAAGISNKARKLKEKLVPAEGIAAPPAPPPATPHVDILDAHRKVLDALSGKKRGAP